MGKQENERAPERCADKNKKTTQHENEGKKGQRKRN